MAGLINKIFRVCLFAIVAPAVAFGGQSPRAASSKVLTRNQSSDNNVLIRRSATSVIARSTSANARRSGKTVIARPAIARTTSNMSVRSGARVVSSGSNLSRAAVSKSGTARSAVNRSAKNTNINNHVSRAASSRATAVFNDVTKIGGGYASCRDAYATCMDQFCANADDSYRRCFCSNKFQDFRDMSDNLDQALGMLADFQNNNLNVVDKTTAEVDAMYSSTAGEDAIKKDTSASQKMLDEIGDILSGKKSNKKNNFSVSTGILNFGDLSDTGDIWSGSDGSIFNQSPTDNISGLEGDALYKRASSQCAAITRDSCSSDALFNLASSAYSVMVTQDCNVVEKSINAKKESVSQTVRKAESLLREARLEEYRAHNSQDVNECLEKVEEAMTQPLVCGENYIKCLDYTGKYINATTGEPIYNELFNISSIAPNLVDGDIIAANSRWSQELENKRQYAATALDTCRSLAEDVWYEFKRMTLIRIAQKQDELVQNAKESCISVIKDCYNAQTGELNEFAEVDDDQYNFGAGAVVMARATCYDKVMSCAALYGDSDGCQYDRATRKISAIKDKKCGFQALLTFVDTVDSSKVASECETTLTARAHDICTPASGTYKTDVNGNYVIDKITGNYVLSEYPDRCATMSKPQLRADLTDWANKFCALDMVRSDESNTSGRESAFNTEIVNRVIKNIFDELGLAFAMGCEDSHGIWYDDGATAVKSWASGILTVDDLNQDYYKTYYGGTSLQSILGSIKAGDIGVCLEASGEKSCDRLGGTFSNNTCTIPKEHKEKMCTWLDSKGKISSNGCDITNSGKRIAPSGETLHREKDLTKGGGLASDSTGFKLPKPVKNYYNALDTNMKDKVKDEKNYGTSPHNIIYMNMKNMAEANKNYISQPVINEYY